MEGEAMNKAEQKRTTRHNRTKRVSKYHAKVYGTTDPEVMTALGLDAPAADAYPEDDSDLHELALDIVKRDEDSGLCLACGDEAYGVEQDATNYECESCGGQVVGAMTYLVMNVA
jgi:predicted RNA-binding Zn-ribbon protein involved in translation (DUF1610 family)